MLQKGGNLGEVELAVRHHVPRQILQGLPLSWDVLGVFYLLYGVLMVIGSTLGVFASIPVHGLVICLMFFLLMFAGFSLLHKLQRGPRPKETFLRKRKLDWLVLRISGERMWVSGLANPLWVCRAEHPLHGLEVVLVPAKSNKPERFRLSLVPYGGRRLSLMDISCSETEAQQLRDLLQEQIDRAAERHGQGVAEIPEELRHIPQRHWDAPQKKDR